MVEIVGLVVTEKMKTRNLLICFKRDTDFDDHNYETLFKGGVLILFEAYIEYS